MDGKRIGMKKMGRLKDSLLELSLLGYTRVGYRARHLEPLRDRRFIEGKRVLVTGATSGLGEATALRLAELGARVTLVGRSQEKLDASIAKIREAVPNAELRSERADLAIMHEVAALADRLLARDEPLHVLVNNAGVLLPERELTKEGLERTFATNLLGHAILTERLMPLLIRAAPSRILNVSSGGMYTQRIRPDDLETARSSYEGAAVYARTKRGQVILTEHWAERLASRGVVVHAMHPGWADTAGVRTSLPGFHRLTQALLRDADEGADTIVWLAAAEEPARSSGLFWHDRRPWPTHRLRSTRETPEERARFLRALEDHARRVLGG